MCTWIKCFSCFFIYLMGLIGATTIQNIPLFCICSVTLTLKAKWLKKHHISRQPFATSFLEEMNGEALVQCCNTPGKSRYFYQGYFSYLLTYESHQFLLGWTVFWGKPQWLQLIKDLFCFPVHADTQRCQVTKEVVDNLHSLSIKGPFWCSLSLYIPVSRAEEEEKRQ